MLHSSYHARTIEVLLSVPVVDCLTELLPGNRLLVFEHDAF